MPDASSPVAIVTGASSGIGLALTRHLVSKGWRVVMADINEAVDQQIAQELGFDQALFHKTDISSWADQVSPFQRTWQWSGSGRVDLLVANAGIVRFDNICDQNSDEPSKEPPLEVLKVDLFSVFYGLKLFVYYSQKNAQPGGKVIVTSSPTGIYPFPLGPEYCSAKHGVVGLVRSMGPRLREKRISVNAVLPGFVLTGATPSEVRSLVPEHYLTSQYAVCKAYNTFLDDPSLSGECLEASVDKVYFSRPPPYCDDAQAFITSEVWTKMG